MTMSSEEALSILKRGEHVLKFLNGLSDAISVAVAKQAEIITLDRKIKKLKSDISTSESAFKRQEADQKVLSNKTSDAVAKMIKDLEARKLNHAKLIEDMDQKAKDYETAAEKRFASIRSAHGIEMKAMKEEAEKVSSKIATLKGTLSTLQSQLKGVSPEALGI